MKAWLHILPRKHLLVIFAFSCLLIIPAFVLGSGGHDLQCQSIWIKIFSYQFWHGNLYPRWLMDMQAGRGSPVFFYYPPLAYFFTALFYPLAPLGDFGYPQIAGGAWLSVFLSGIAFYVWMRRETQNSAAALTASLLYMALPEHIAINFYSLLMPSTMWVYVWLPLLFMACKETMVNRAAGILPLSILLCLLLLTNIPQTAIWGMLVGCYCLLFIRRQDMFWQCGKLAGAAALGLGLAAFYLLPMAFYKDFVNASWQKDSVQLGSDMVDKSQYIFFLGKGQPLNIMLTVFYALSIIALFLYSKKTDDSRQKKFFIFAAIIALIFMDNDTMAVWKLLPIYVIQFAERLFTVTSLVLAVLAAYSYPRTRIWSYCLLVACIAFTAYWPTQSRSSLEQVKELAPQVYRQWTLNIDQFPDYLTTPDLYTLYNAYGYEYSGKLVGAGKMSLVPLEVATRREKIYVLSGDASIVIKKWEPRSIILSYKADADSTLLVRQFMYPGFTATLKGKELELMRDNHTGQIVMELPAGEGDVTLTLTALLPEIAGKAISLLCAGIAVLLLLLRMRSRARLQPA